MATTDHTAPAEDPATAADSLFSGGRGLVGLVPPAIAVAVCIPAVGGLTALRWAMVACIVAAAWIHATGREGTAAVELTVYATTSVCWLVAASTPFTVSAFDQIAIAVCLAEIAVIWQDRRARSRRGAPAGSTVVPFIGAALMLATVAMLAIGMPRQVRFALSRAQLDDPCVGFARCYLVQGSRSNDGVDLGDGWRAMNQLHEEDLGGVSDDGF